MSLKLLCLILVFSIVYGGGYRTKQQEQTEAQKFGQKVLESVPAAMTIAMFLQLNEQVEFFRTNKAIQKLQDIYFQYSGISTITQPLKSMNCMMNSQIRGAFHFALVFVDLRGCMEFDHINEEWRVRHQGKFGYHHEPLITLRGLTAKMDFPGYGVRDLLSERVHIQTARAFNYNFEILLLFQGPCGSLYRLSNIIILDERVILEYETPRYVPGKMQYWYKRYPGGYVWGPSETVIELSENGAVFYSQNKSEKLENVANLLTHKIVAPVRIRLD